MSSEASGSSMSSTSAKPKVKSYRTWDAVRLKLLDGEPPEGIWDGLLDQAKAAGFEVVREQKRSGNGYCDSSTSKSGVWTSHRCRLSRPRPRARH